MQKLPDLSLLNRLADEIHTNAKEHGFTSPPPQLGLTQEQWDSPESTVPRSAMMATNLHGEVSEFWEAVRKGALHNPCDKAKAMHDQGLAPLTNAEEELADILIRTLDMAHTFGVDIGKAVAVKMAYNKSRPFRHGNKLA